MHPGAPAGPPYPYPPTPPRRPPRPAGHLAAGVFWLVAAGLAVGALFGDIDVQQATSSVQVYLGFWTQRVAGEGSNNSTASLLLGVTVIVGAVALAGAGLLAFASRRKWVPVVAGTLGTGLIVNEALGWAVRPLTPTLHISVLLGWWLIVAAGLVAVIGFVISLVARPARRYAPPPPPPQRWEPPTPRYGVPVQQAPEEESGNEK
jgi:hypothetical protein